jgi:hypothetical protein
MNTDPHLKSGIIEKLDTANQLQTGVTRHHGVVVIGMRRAEQRDQTVTTFLANNAAVATNRHTHGIQRRLQPHDRGLRIKVGDQIRRALQIGTEDGEIFSLAGDPVANISALRFGPSVRHDSTARRTEELASFQR